MYLARLDGIDFCNDQDKVVSATRVVFGGISASEVNWSDGELSVKVALGELRVSSCSVNTSVVGSSFSRTMSMYLRSPINFGVPTFLRGLDGLGYCSTGEGSSGVLSNRIGFFSELSIVAASGASPTEGCSVDPVRLGLVD